MKITEQPNYVKEFFISAFGVEKGNEYYLKEVSIFEKLVRERKAKSKNVQIELISVAIYQTLRGEGFNISEITDKMRKYVYRKDTDNEMKSDDNSDSSSDFICQVRELAEKFFPGVKVFLSTDRKELENETDYIFIYTDQIADPCQLRTINVQVMISGREYTGYRVISREPSNEEMIEKLNAIFEDICKK